MFPFPNDQITSCILPCANNHPISRQSSHVCRRLRASALYRRSAGAHGMDGANGDGCRCGGEGSAPAAAPSQPAEWAEWAESTDSTAPVSSQSWPSAMGQTGILRHGKPIMNTGATTQQLAIQPPPAALFRYGYATAILGPAMTAISRRYHGAEHRLGKCVLVNGI